MLASENLTPEQAEELTVYPPRSLGEAFRRYRRIDEWSRKAPRTREDWWRGWRRIKPIFGDTDPRTVTLEDVSAWRKVVEDTVSLREAHRCVKIWRALWKVAAALGYCVRDADPSLGVRNSAAKGRSETWSEGEAVRLFKQAWRDGYYGLSAIIAVSWATQMSPGDVRALRASQLAQGCEWSSVLCSARQNRKACGRLHLTTVCWSQCRRTSKSSASSCTAKPTSSAIGAARPTPVIPLGDDFRAVRIAVFGERDKRTLADFRRSGAQEAIAGEATPAALAHAMGNTLSPSNALFDTYCPVNLTTIRSVMEARRRGRVKLRGNG